MFDTSEEIPVVHEADDACDPLSQDPLDPVYDERLCLA